MAGALLMVSATGAWISLVGATIQDVDGVAPYNAGISLVLNSDGTVDYLRNIQADSFEAQDWISPASEAPGPYSVRATVLSGSLSSGTTGSWLALTSNRSWSRTRTSVGTSSCQLQLEISPNGGTTVIKTVTFTLNAVCTA